MKEAANGKREAGKRYKRRTLRNRGEETNEDRTNGCRRKRDEEANRKREAGRRNK